MSLVKYRARYRLLLYERTFVHTAQVTTSPIRSCLLQFVSDYLLRSSSLPQLLWSVMQNGIAEHVVNGHDGAVVNGIETDVSPYDNAVLNRVFNPHLPYEEIKSPEPDVEEELTDAVLKSKDLEMSGVKAAEEKNLDKAIEYFNDAINIAPNRASCFNNRAQARRLKGDRIGALADLDRAIELSEGRGRAACQAFTQRAILRRLDGRDEESLQDFKAAADLGGDFAKSMLVKLNPFAAMCNQMLAEVFCKLREGEQA